MFSAPFYDFQTPQDRRGLVPPTPFSQNLFSMDINPTTALQNNSSSCTFWPSNSGAQSPCRFTNNGPFEPIGNFEPYQPEVFQPRNYAGSLGPQSMAHCGPQNFCNNTFATASSTTCTNSTGRPILSNPGISLSSAQKCRNASNQSKNEQIVYKEIMKELKDIRKGNEQFQNTVIHELSKLNRTLASLSTSLSNEIPAKIAETLTTSINSIISSQSSIRSRSVSVVSESELADLLNCDLTLANNETKDGDKKEEESDFYNKATSDSSDDESISKTTEELSVKANEASATKFVFEYDSTLDLDKWLRKI